MKKFIVLTLLSGVLSFINTAFAQLSASESKALIEFSAELLKPGFSYQYNINSNFIKQNIQKRKGDFFWQVQPKDTLELLKGLKNDTSDAKICLDLFFLYRKLHKNASADYYLNKSLNLFLEKSTYYPNDSAIAMNLALLYSAANDFEGGKKGL